MCGVGGRGRDEKSSSRINLERDSSKACVRTKRMLMRMIFAEPLALYEIAYPRAQSISSDGASHFGPQFLAPALAGVWVWARSDTSGASICNCRGLRRDEGSALACVGGRWEMQARSSRRAQRSAIELDDHARGPSSLMSLSCATSTTLGLVFRDEAPE